MKVQKYRDATLKMNCVPATGGSHPLTVEFIVKYITSGCFCSVPLQVEMLQKLRLQVFYMHAKDGFIGQSNAEPTV